MTLFCCRALPLLVFHRQNWNILRPIVVLNDSAVIADLKSAANYVAGVIDPQVNRIESEFAAVILYAACLLACFFFFFF
jgi:hypothetical protein